MVHRFARFALVALLTAAPLAAQAPEARNAQRGDAVTGVLLSDDGKASVHAWAEACDEGLGWIGFDPLLNVCPTEQHIRLASGLDAMGTMPVRMVPMWTQMPDERVEIAEG